MKNFASLALILFTFLSSNLYSQKKVVAFAQLKNNTKISESSLKAIEQRMLEALSNTNRFELVDRTDINLVKSELELQKSEEFLEGKTVKQNNWEGAEQIITGAVDQVVITENVTEDGDIYYTASIYISLKVIDVATGKVVASETMRVKEGLGSGILSIALNRTATPQQAFNRALTGIDRAIEKFVAHHFPLTTEIIEILESSPSYGAKKILINIGTKLGAYKGQIYKVFEIQKLKVKNKELTRKKEIGKVKITKVEGDEVSQAKVLKGGKEILENFKNGVQMEFQSKN